MAKLPTNTVRSSRVPGIKIVKKILDLYYNYEYFYSCYILSNISYFSKVCSLKSIDISPGTYIGIYVYIVIKYTLFLLLNSPDRSTLDQLELNSV